MSGAQEQMAAIYQLLDASGAPKTTENYNRASLHMARGDDNATPMFERAMQRAVASPTPRQLRQQTAQLPTPPPDPSAQPAEAAAPPLEDISVSEGLVDAAPQPASPPPPPAPVDVAINRTLGVTGGSGSTDSTAAPAVAVEPPATGQLYAPPTAGEYTGAAVAPPTGMIPLPTAADAATERSRWPSVPSVVGGTAALAALAAGRGGARGLKDARAILGANTAGRRVNAPASAAGTNAPPAAAATAPAATAKAPPSSTQGYGPRSSTAPASPTAAPAAPLAAANGSTPFVNPGAPPTSAQIASATPDAPGMPRRMQGAEDERLLNQRVHDAGVGSALSSVPAGPAVPPRFGKRSTPAIPTQGPMRVPPGAPAFMPPDAMPPGGAPAMIPPGTAAAAPAVPVLPPPGRTASRPMIVLPPPGTAAAGPPVPPPAAPRPPPLGQGRPAMIPPNAAAPTGAPAMIPPGTGRDPRTAPVAPANSRPAMIPPGAKAPPVAVPPQIPPGATSPDAVAAGALRTYDRNISKGNLPRYTTPEQISATMDAAAANPAGRATRFDTQGGKRSLTDAVAARRRASQAQQGKRAKKE